MTDSRYVMKLQVLRRSRKAPRQGDVFAFKLEGGDYHFGRVIDPGLKMLDWDVVLSYLFRTSSSDKEQVPPLRLDELLLPPLLIDPGCWRLGYLETVSHQPLGLGDALGRHCFRDALPVAMGQAAVYVDEHGRRLDRRFEPCGDYGMVPAVGLDRQVRRALGLAFSPD